MGWFLSVVGFAPSQATVQDYYAPLVAFYIRCCYLVAGSRESMPSTIGIMFAPSSFDATKPSVDDAALNLFLGSCLGRPSKGRLQKICEEKRWLIQQQGDSRLRNDESPLFLAEMERHSYGNCAESYSFCNLFL